MASLLKRGKNYFLQFYRSGKKQVRLNLFTKDQGIAEDRLRSFESAQARGMPSPFPTHTRIESIVSDYVEYVRQSRRHKSAQTTVYYLRNIFGPICEALKNTSLKGSGNLKKRTPRSVRDERLKRTVLQCAYLEQISTLEISSLIQAHMRIRTQLGIRPMAAKTANRYRETLATLFNWATKEKNVRLPGGINPALSVQRYPEPHPRIQFLTFTQIDEQLKALEELPQLQAMVAVYIYAGLRREELLWLTHEDIDWNAEPFGLISIRAKSVAGESWQPKTFGSNRSVPISSVLRPYLDRQRLRSAQSIWLFPNSAGGRYDPDNFSSDLRRANLKAGLAWGCLIFRHTFGTRLAKKGESLFKISVLMGNSPEICRRHYAALSASELTETVEFKPVRDASNARSQSAFA